MQILIGDIGNTITKVCLVELKNFKIKKIFYLNSKRVDSNNFLKNKFKKIIKKNNICKITLFSSVVPKYKLLLKKFLKKNHKIILKEIKDINLNKIIKINIKNSKQVGSDRIANAVGAYKKFGSNSIVLDFGTATTFDVVTKNLSIKSLTSSADQIPLFSIKSQKKVIGKNTIEALRSGFYWGYTGLINNIITKIEKESKKKHKIIFTGGYADLFKTSITRKFIIDKNITIKGIIEIFKVNRKKLIK